MKNKVRSVTLFLLVIALISGLYIYAHRNITFNTSVWKNYHEQRPFMVKSLLDEFELTGMNRAEIHHLLGDPKITGDTVTDNYYAYWAGSAGIDDMWLEIHFEDDVVIVAKYVPD